MKHLNSTAYAALMLVALCYFCPVAAQVQTARHVDVNPNCGGYYEYLPQGYNWETQSYPLIVFLHGVGELGNGTTQLPLVLNNGIPKLINSGQFPVSFNVNGQTHKFIVISPQFKQWPTPTDINSVISYAIQHYRVNSSRIYVTGLSMGGGATWEYAGNQNFANRVAAVVPVCGASWPSQERAQVIASNRIAVWATHNDGDWTVPVSYTNDYINYINSCNANPVGKKSIWQIVSHDAWTRTYDPDYRENGLNVYEWMLQYTKGSSTNQPPSVHAGNAQTITLPVNSVTLNGSAWDSDGSIVSYNWTQVSGPVAIIASPFSNNTQVTGLVAGTYVFRLTATDNQGANNSSTVQIIVNAASNSTSAGRIEAEHYIAMHGVQTENTWDVGGGLNVGWIDNSDWMDYNITAPAAGTYTIQLRVASPNHGARFQIKKQDGSVLSTVDVPNTGGWQNWHTINTTVSLSSGSQIIRISSITWQGWNINWLEPQFTSNAPAGITTRVEAENWAAMHGVQTENAWGDASGGGLLVGWIDPGDWMDYHINVATAGTYTMKFRIASPNNSAAFEVRKADGTVLTTVEVPNTSGWQSFQTISKTVSLAAGAQTIRLHSISAQGWNINWFELEPGGTPPPPPPPPPATTSSKIEAEHYVSMHGIQTENTWDAGGGQNVGWIDNNDWMDYSVNVAATGTYTLRFRVASGSWGAQFQVKKSDGTVLTTVSVPHTGGWQNWQTVSASVNLTAGTQTIRLQSTTWNGWNINWWEIAGTTTPPPPPTSFSGRIEAEAYAAMHGIQTEDTWDVGGGKNVGWIDNGDWMDYQVNIPSAGTYTMRFRVASPNSGTGFQIKKANGSVLGSVSVPNTGWWQGWQTITTTVTLEAGVQTIRLQSTSWNGWNINWLEIESASSSTIAGRTLEVQEEAKAGLAQVYPNPAVDRVTLTIDNQYTGTLRVFVADVSGRIQKQLAFTKPNKGSTQAVLSIGDLPKGTYVLKAIMDDWTKGATIIKQ